MSTTTSLRLKTTDKRYSSAFDWSACQMRPKRQQRERVRAACASRLMFLGLLLVSAAFAGCKERCPEGTTPFFGRCAENPCGVPCTGSTPVCDPKSLRCVACVDNSECTDAALSQCGEEGRCVPCTGDNSCTHLEETPLCAENISHCIACRSDEDCETGLCHVIAGRCEEDVQAGSAKVAEPCISTSHCDEGMVCAPEPFESISSLVVARCAEDELRDSQPCQAFAAPLPPVCMWRQGDDVRCADKRPFFRDDLTVQSIEGETGVAVCVQRRNTMAAYHDTIDTENLIACTPEAEMSTSCGIPNVPDAFCSINVQGPTAHCTITCASENDCPVQYQCSSVGGTNVCTFVGT